MAEEIEYSQPVLYSHFEDRNAIVRAVALQGFGEIAYALQQILRRSRGAEQALLRLAEGYLDFAAANPALYEAMFTLPVALHFAEDCAEPELRAAFQPLLDAVAPYSLEKETAAELLWCALHGLVELDRAGRTRRSFATERIKLLVHLMSTNASPPRRPAARRGTRERPP